MDSHYSISFTWMYLRLIIILYNFLFITLPNACVHVANFDNKPYGKKSKLCIQTYSGPSGQSLFSPSHSMKK